MHQIEILDAWNFLHYPLAKTGGKMSITVKKAGDTEKNEMESKPIWECEVSEFDWHYDSEERCL